MNVFELFAKISLDTKEYTSGMSSVISDAKNVAKTVSKVVTAGVTAATAATVAFAKSSVDAGMEFDKSMSQVAATLGMTVDEIGDLRDFAQEMGRTTAFSAIQAADALNYMALAGYDSQTSIAMLPNVLNLAAAGGMDLARASDMITDSQSALGLSLDETSALVDKMAKASSKSNTSVMQLGDAILTVGGTAKVLSGGTTELATALGILADNGVKGSEGGTALRNIILSLTAPTKEAAKTLNNLGVAVFDASGNMRSFNDVFGDLNRSLAILTQEERMNALSDIFNNRDLKSAEALLTNAGARWKELSGYIDEAQGAAEKMANTQLDNLVGDVTLLKSAAEGAQIAFSDGVTPALRKVIEMITKALSKDRAKKWLKDAGEKLGDLITKIAHGVKNALPRLLKLLDDNGKKVKVFGIAVATAIITIKAAANPIGALGSALALLGGTMAVASLTADDLKTRISKLTDDERDNLETILELVSGYNDVRSERNKNMSVIEEETKKIDSLWQELKTLADENGRVTEANRDRAEYILGELNKAMGTEYSLNGDVIDQYQQMQKEIDALIQKRKAERMIEVNQQVYDEAVEGLKSIGEAIYDQQRELDAANASVTAYEKSIEALENELKYATGFGAGGTIALQVSTSVAIEKAKKELEDARKLAEEQQKNYDDLLAQEQAYYYEKNRMEQAYALEAEGTVEAYKKIDELFAKDTYNRYRYMVDNHKLSEEELKNLEKELQVARGVWERYRKGVEENVEGYSTTTSETLYDSFKELSDLYREAYDAYYNLGQSAAEGYKAGFENYHYTTSSYGDTSIRTLAPTLYEGDAAKSTTVILEIDKNQLGRVVFDLNRSEATRRGVRLAE